MVVGVRGRGDARASGDGGGGDSRASLALLPGRGGQAAATATAATLVAVDFDGVLFALEGGGAAIPIARAGLVSLAEEERPRGSESDRPREESDAAAEAEINAARAKEAAEVTACPGAPAVLHALAAVAAAKSDARALVRILATVRVPGSSSSFLEESDAGVAADAVSERFDPASAAANGDVGRVLCRLPGGSALWGDPRVWRGLEPLLDPPRSGVFGGPAGCGTLGASGSVGLTGSPGSPGSPGSSRRRRRALAAAMASVGLPAHAVASLLARLGLEETATRAPPLPGDSPDAGDGPAPRSSGEMNRFSGRRTGAKTASGGLGSGRTGTGSRVGRSIARVWDVTTTAPPETLVAVAVGSGPGVAVSHDCWIESLRDVVAETAAPTFAARAAADAPRWALDERTRGADRLPFRTVFSSDDELDSSDREDCDEDSDPYAIRHRSRRVRRGGFVGGAARLPGDAASARVFSSPATVVATQLGGGAVAAGSANGGFAVWRPDTGVVTRAAAGGWGEGGAGDDNAVTFTADGAAFTALGFLTESAESAPAGDDPPRPGLVVGGTPRRRHRRVGRRHGRVRARRARVARRRGHFRASRGDRRAWIPCPRALRGRGDGVLARAHRVIRPERRVRPVMGRSPGTEGGGGGAHGPRGRGHGDEPRRGERRGGALRR